jgi:uncharacterized membrane protein YhaH (DUF805 family)
MLGTLVASFDPRRRRNRQYYFAYHLALIILGIVLMIAYALLGYVVLPVFGFESGLPDLEGALWFEVPKWIVFIVMTILGFAVLAQRCHDIGWPGWLGLIVLIPYLGAAFWLALFFIPGAKGPNRYGADPREAHQPS